MLIRNCWLTEINARTGRVSRNASCNPLSASANARMISIIELTIMFGLQIHFSSAEVLSHHCVPYGFMTIANWWCLQRASWLIPTAVLTPSSTGDGPSGSLPCPRPGFTSSWICTLFLPLTERSSKASWRKQMKLWTVRQTVIVI
jgi:hypothetical protein